MDQAALNRIDLVPLIVTKSSIIAITKEHIRFCPLHHMGPEGVRNRKKHPYFLLMQNSQDPGNGLKSIRGSWGDHLGSISGASRGLRSQNEAHI